MSELKASHEQRLEYAVNAGNRKSARSLVRMPGKSGYEATTESAATIARRIQLEKLERRARR